MLGGLLVGALATRSVRRSSSTSSPTSGHATAPKVHTVPLGDGTSARSPTTRRCRCSPPRDCFERRRSATRAKGRRCGVDPSCLPRSLARRIARSAASNPYRPRARRTSARGSRSSSTSPTACGRSTGLGPQRTVAGCSTSGCCTPAGARQDVPVGTVRKGPWHARRAAQQQQGLRRRHSRRARIGALPGHWFAIGVGAAALTHGHPSGYLPAGVLAHVGARRFVRGATLPDAITAARVKLEQWPDRRPPAPSTKRWP